MWFVDYSCTYTCLRTYIHTSQDKINYSELFCAWTLCYCTCQFPKSLCTIIYSVGTIMSTAVIRAMFFKLEESSAYRVKKTLHCVVKTRLCSQATEVNKRQPLHVCLCTLKASQRRLLRQDNRLQCVVSLHDNFSRLSYVKHLWQS